MSTNPFLVRRAQHKIGKAGRKSETRMATKISGRLRPASGAMPGAKGDIVIADFLVEAKSTTRDSLGVKFDWLINILRYARGEGKKPALTVSFVAEDGKPKRDGDWVLIRLSDFQELTGDKEE